MIVRRTHLSVLLVAGVFTCLAAFAQQTAPTVEPSGAVPPLVNFASTLSEISGKPIIGVTGVTFLLYRDQQGGSPLWMETQTVTTDENGRYSVILGAGSAAGLPTNLFAAGESRWLAVQPHGEIEQPRILLLSVPYALKAGDAATVGGLPASAFMLANSGAAAGESSNSIPSAATASATGKAATPANPAVTGKGTLNFIPMWDSASDIVNSLIFQKGAGIGINTTAPVASLDVNGRTDIRDALTLFPKGTDNALLLSGTNFKVTSTGLVTFVSGQTFPGTGKGTITGIMTPAGSGLSGGGATGTLTLKVLAAGITNAMLQNSTVTLNANGAGGLTAPGAMTLGSTYTIGLKPCSANQILQYSGSVWNCATAGTGTITGVTAGTNLTGGGTTGSVTLNVDTTKVPQLAAANTFSGTEKFNGNVGIGAPPFTNTYTPLALGGATTFGTWLSLANTSTGGHTWNFLSAGSGNAEGAGNLGITDLSGTSTIWLEGNANITQNLAVTGSSGGAIVDADVQGKNAGTPTPGLRFGGPASGEGIASNRVGGLDAFGLDFYTEFTSRMLISQDGRVGIGTFHPVNQLEVDSTSNGYAAIFTQGGAAPAGSGQNGSDGIDAYGNSGDGAGEGGSGGLFSGGGAGASGLTGEGIVVFGGTELCLPICVPENYAGDFQGSIFVGGSVDGAEVVTSIDHPTDPANKYLMHSSVQSPDMKNIYDGVATLDAGGEAVIQMPEWFGALNRDFRYQLTCIGGFAPVYVAGELANNQFKIGGGREGMKISWQVTGIRQDAWANAHRTPVELEKPDREKGFYLHPELYGASQEQGIIWARNPEMMKRRLAAQLHSADAQAAAKTVHAISAGR
jgi:trimeric autotransporter adhesin